MAFKPNLKEAGDIIKSKEWNDAMKEVTLLRKALDSMEKLIVPKGSIIMWSGKINEIPAGWVLCDGASDAVPDLRDRFIVGAGSSYNTKEMGGAAEVQITIDQLPAHSHGSGSLNASGGEHGHHVPGFLHADDNNHTFSDRFAGGDNPHHPYNIGIGGGGHNHSINGSTANSGSGKPHENRPPFYALAFIIKL